MCVGYTLTRTSTKAISISFAGCFNLRSHALIKITTKRRSRACTKMDPSWFDEAIKSQDEFLDNCQLIVANWVMRKLMMINESTALNGSRSQDHDPSQTSETLPWVLVKTYLCFTKLLIIPFSLFLLSAHPPVSNRFLQSHLCLKKNVYLFSRL